MLDGNDEPIEDAGPPAGAEFAHLAPNNIRRNPKNPRRFFKQATIEALAESISNIGVQVPVTVYAEEAEDGTTHVLLDGERRWLASTFIDLPEMPAWVVPKPSDLENVLRMFNIHMLREEWSEIATAWALEALMEDVGTRSPQRLHELTGMSTDRITNMLTVLSFPRHLQERIAEGELPYQFLVELDKAVLRAVRRDAGTFMGKSEAQVRDVFVDKYERGTVGDIVDLRKVGKLIRTSREHDYTGEQARDALERLIANPEVTIEEAFEEGAAASLEVTKVLRDIENLPKRIGFLLIGELHEEHRARLLNGIEYLRRELEAFTPPAE